MTSSMVMSRVWNVAEGALLGALLGLSLWLLEVTTLLKVGDPAMIGLVGAGFGAVVGGLGLVRWLVVLDAPVFLLLLLVTFVPWTGFADRFVRADTPPGPVDAVVVLSSGMFADSTISNAGLDRLLTGIDLVERGVARRLITTRMEDMYHGVHVTNDADIRRVVHLAGVDSAWTMVGPVAVTRDEAVSTAKLLLPGAQRIVVVTSPSHTRRACATFEKVGFQVWCWPALERDQRSSHATNPSQRLEVFGSLLYETAGLLKYRALGWI
jgi:uncharacterized SAM-binding protein YcdF (DUF218 family)